VLADLKTVIELQKVDLKIAELAERIAQYPARIEALASALKQFIQAHEERKGRLAASQKQRRDLEGEIQLIREKISRHKDQLYEVKTNEQYKAMLKEIEGEEAKARGVEDRILEKMIEAEELQKQISDAAALLEGEKARVERETRELDAHREADLREREGLRVERKQLDAALGETVRSIYERVRAGRHGVALAEARDGFCTGCNISLRPQAYNEVRTNEMLVTCENCSRILYYVPPADPAGAGPEAQAKDAHASA
jgi:uncharacterized protein